MSDAPHTRCEDVRGLTVLIETGPATGSFTADPRVSVRDLTLACDDKLSAARLSVFAGPLGSSSRASEPALHMGDFLNAGQRPGYEHFLSPNQQILIVRELEAGPILDDEAAGDVPGLLILFRGLCDRPAAHKNTDGANTREGFEITAESVWKRQADTEAGQIVGRRQRTSAAETALDEFLLENEEAVHDPFARDPANPLDDLAWVRARPCVFNPHGRGNRSPTPIEITIGGRVVGVHVFCDEHDADAEQWTWAQMLRYLVVFHLMDEPGEEEWDDAASWVVDGNILDETERDVGDPAVPMWLAALSDRPTAPVEAADGLAFALLGEPSSLNLDSVNITESMNVVAQLAGVHYRVETRNRQRQQDQDDGQGGTVTVTVQTAEPVDYLFVWARGSGPVRDLLMAATAADRGQTLAALLELSNLSGIEIEVDSGDTLSRPLPIGDVRRYEITAQLVPGWVTDDKIDVAPAGVEAALTYAELHEDLGDDPESLIEDPYYKRYHTAGADHADYTAPGRRWVLNETGRYENDYARATGPWDAARYQPWDPSSPYGPVGEMEAGLAAILVKPLKHLIIGEDGVQVDEVVGQGTWSRVARPLSNCFSADSDLRSMGVYVEWSIDAGVSWQPLQCAIRLLRSQAGLHIDAEDLWAVRMSPDDDGQNSFWGAYVRGVLRVRVTAVIEGDGRIEPRVQPDLFGPPAGREAVRLIDVSSRFHSNDRDGGNSQFQAGSANELPNQVRGAGVDLNALQAYAIELMELCSARQFSVSATIPWIETTAYKIGDCVREVRGAGLVLEQFVAAQQRRFVDIVGVQYTQNATTLLLEDWRLENGTPSARAALDEIDYQPDLD